MQQPDMSPDETPEQLRARGDQLMIAGDAAGSEACYAEAANREAKQEEANVTNVSNTQVVAGTPVVVATVVGAPVVAPMAVGSSAPAALVMPVKRTTSDSSSSAFSVDSDVVIVKRVCVAVGSLVQGLCFELSDGTRNGYFLREAPAGDLEEGVAVPEEETIERRQSRLNRVSGRVSATLATSWEMQFLDADELKEDSNLLSRGGQWYDLETTDDMVVKVHGQNTIDGQQLRCANIHFTMRSGRVVHFEGKQQPGPEGLVHFEFAPEGHSRFLGVEITEEGVVGLRDPEMRCVSQFLRDNGIFTDGSPSELRMRRLLYSDHFMVFIAAITFLNALFLILVLAGVVGTGYGRSKDEEHEPDFMAEMIRQVFLTVFVCEHGAKLYAFRSYIKRLEPLQMVLSVIGLGRYPQNGFYGTVAFVALLLDTIVAVSWDPWVITLGKTLDSGFAMLRLMKKKGIL